MLHGMKRTFALAALILLAMTGTAQAKAPDPKAACKQGGFVGYVNPATGQPFADQSQCVSFVARGGTLVPYVPEPPAPTATIVNSFAPLDSGQCVWSIRLTDYPRDTVETVSTTLDNFGGIPINQNYTVMTDSTGSASFTVLLPAIGDTASASTTDPAASDTDTVSC